MQSKTVIGMIRRLAAQDIAELPNGQQRIAAFQEIAGLVKNQVTDIDYDSPSGNDVRIFPSGNPPLTGQPRKGTLTQ